MLREIIPSKLCNNQNWLVPGLCWSVQRPVWKGAGRMWKDLEKVAVGAWKTDWSCPVLKMRNHSFPFSSFRRKLTSCCQRWPSMWSWWVGGGQAHFGNALLVLGCVLLGLWWQHGKGKTPHEVSHQSCLGLTTLGFWTWAYISETASWLTPLIQQWTWRPGDNICFPAGLTELTLRVGTLPTWGLPCVRKWRIHRESGFILWFLGRAAWRELWRAPDFSCPQDTSAGDPPLLATPLQFQKCPSLGHVFPWNLQAFPMHVFPWCRRSFQRAWPEFFLDSIFDPNAHALYKV